MGLALIVHGGAGLIPPERHAPAQEGCRKAALAGWQVLRAGGSAVEAVRAAITVLEDDPGFNAGTGGVLTKDGRAELDAGIMDGAVLQVGAVAGVTRIKNPIQLASAVLTSPHVLLVGEGAEQFAATSGIALVDNSALVTPAQRARWQHGYRQGDDVNVGEAGTLVATTDPDGIPPSDLVHSDGEKHGTVGAVAVDSAGHIAAGASTGGIGAKHPGRVGDTPLAGCGFYAEDDLGGVSSTGHGEDFIRLLLAKRAADYLGQGLDPMAAAAAAIRVLGERTNGSGGLILLDPQGRPGFARNTGSMAYAYLTEGMDAPKVGV